MNLVRTLKNGVHYLNASLASLCYGYPAKRLTVIGVTGTDGKTTTSSLLYHILKINGHKTALISTVAAYIGNDQVDTGFHVTSPAPWQLQRLIKRIADNGFTHLVLEATSHGLDQHRLLHTNIAVAVVTNITHEHLDYHRTYERYLAAKARIFTDAGYAVINEDDASYELLKKQIPSTCQTVTYSLAHFRNLNLAEIEAFTRTVGRRFPELYNQMNSLAAIAAAKAVGITPVKAIAAITSFPGVTGRMQPVPNSKGITAIVDFAHTPNALKNALMTVRGMTKGKVIVVFGAAGKRDISKRPLMGQVASELADEVVLTAEDPRGENMYLNIAQIKSGVTHNQGHVHGIPDRNAAIRFAVSLAKPGDVVIACGKGHERSMNLDGSHEIPWSDANVLAKALE